MISFFFFSAMGKMEARKGEGGELFLEVGVGEADLWVTVSRPTCR
jgi:hypothetical protein